MTQQSYVVCIKEFASNDLRHPYTKVHRRMFTIAKKWKQPECPSMNK